MLWPHALRAPLKHSDDTILCMMMGKVVYHLPYGQLIGFLAIIFNLMGLLRSEAVVNEACDPWIIPRNEAISEIIGLD